MSEDKKREYVNESGQLVVISKAGEEFIIDGVNYAELPNGAIADKNNNGQIVTIREGRSLWVDPDKARQSAVVRWERAHSAAMQGIHSAYASTPTAFDAWSNIIASQAELAGDIDKGKASTLAAIFVGKAAGFYSDRPENYEAALAKIQSSGKKELRGLLDGLSVDQLRLLFGVLIQLGKDSAESSGDSVQVIDGEVLEDDNHPPG